MTDHPFAVEAEIVKRATGFPAGAAAELAIAGGLLRCEACQGERPLDDVAGYVRGGWPRHCGARMTWVTLRALAFESREVPDGFELVAVPDEDWRVEVGRECVRQLAGHRVCHAPSVASLNRGKMTRRGLVPAFWPYCLGHLYGRWIESGSVMHWVLREAGNPVAGEREDGERD